MSLLRSYFVAVPLLVGCGASQYPSLDEPLPPPAASTPASKPQPAASFAGGNLKRADVEQVVDTGLGRFLSLVTLEPSLVNGKFVGWNVVSFNPPEPWQGVDLQPGDVVTRVNGMAIERETEAYDAFQAVRQAPALDVAYQRQGQDRTLHFDIVGVASPALPKAPPEGASPEKPATKPASPAAPKK